MTQRTALPFACVPQTAACLRDAAAADAPLASSSATDGEQRPLLLVLAATTLPARTRRVSTIREKRSSLEQALDSIYGQTRKADAVVLSVPDNYRRQDDATRAEATDASVAALRTTYEQRAPPLQLLSTVDRGPGTKLLGALPTARRLAAARPGSDAFIVLFDDDQVYNPLALRMLELNIRAARARAHVRANHTAWSFCLYGLSCAPCYNATDSACAARRQSCKARGLPGMTVGQGVDLLALPLHALDGVDGFFDAACRYEPRFFYHDDVWISMFLHDSARTGIRRTRFVNVTTRDGRPRFSSATCQSGTAISRRAIGRVAHPAGALAALHGNVSRIALNAALMAARADMAAAGLLPHIFSSEQVRPPS